MKKLHTKRTKSYQIDSEKFLLSRVKYVASPNQDNRPKGSKPEIIVIHGISLPPGQFGGEYIKDFFLNKLDEAKHKFFQEIRDLKVSSHLLIDRDGKTLQFVPFDRRAWHAGESSFQGKMKCNDFSIGIELEGQDDINYSDSQYKCLVKIIKCLFDFYPDLNARKIVAHSDIAPIRKTDPGFAFDWVKFYELLYKGSL
jgi:AmpD protein